jgi:hypothetical protein
MEWMEATINLTGKSSTSAEKDVRQLVPYIRDIRAHDWRTFIGGRDDWDEFCRSMIGYPAAYLRLLEPVQPG